ncbi:MAG: hypothetical protein C0478_01470 [Planctomyces sp.]|nr:hypothetical protein [Planctomyces sp.]
MRFSRWQLVNSMVCLIVASAVGCGGSGDFKTASQIKQEQGHDDHGHDHGPVGPHGGSLFVLAKDVKDVQGELVVDGKRHALVIFLLAADGKSPVPSTATEVEIAGEGGEKLVLKAAPLEGEAAGQSSRYELVDEKQVHELIEAGFIHGTAKIAVGEKSYTPFLDVHLDDEHDHDHGKEEMK